MATINDREAFVANFEKALRTAGMVRGKTSGTLPTDPMYWRGRVPTIGTNEALYLLYSMFDSLETVAADNKPYLRTSYIYGTVYTRNGRSDEDYQNLLANIQKSCELVTPKITFLLGGESVDTSIDPDSPIEYINFTAYQKRLV